MVEVEGLSNVAVGAATAADGPGGHADKVRHERRDGALQNGRIAQDDVLVVHFDQVARVHHYARHVVVVS